MFGHAGLGAEIPAGMAHSFLLRSHSPVYAIRIPLRSCTVGPVQLGRRRLCIHIAESVFFPPRIRSAG
ncbi:hypothetical protein DVJ83_00850 [Deinococcus wulumuqiensis]|uniref:Uncharacterized protein n=1 Tax=Deinococcus wulumuqiensis TaxID=980427 RepID=A0A345IE34_9DEIO|nr:hypothetical protein DVJ83_00850 [Deinococcus wulumuqiensis]